MGRMTNPTLALMRIAGERAASDRVPASNAEITLGAGSSNEPANGNDATADDQQPHEVLTATEVAAFLRCSRKSVYEAVARHEIPHQRLGRRILFSRPALLDWLACKGSSEGNRD